MTHRHTIFLIFWWLTNYCVQICFQSFPIIARIAWTFLKEPLFVHFIGLWSRSAPRHLSFQLQIVGKYWVFWKQIGYYHDICAVSRYTSNDVRIWHFLWCFLIVTHKYKFYISSWFKLYYYQFLQNFGHQHAPKAAWTCPKISFFEFFPSLEVGLQSMKDQLFLLPQI